jgi:hypothetical protein
MNPNLRKWLQVSLFNLLLVATLGVIMRYKIAYSLPLINQRYLLHAHSHFAFAGWITQALMSLLVNYLYEKGQQAAFRKYRWLLYANLVTAYGMLLSFPFQGYAFLSITFSTLSIFVSYCFAVMLWRDLGKSAVRNIADKWFKAAVFFNAVSSLGAFSLAYMLATKSIHPNSYLASIYFFLHFQYNGWFFFACMGLFSYQLTRYRVSPPRLNTVFTLFLIACVPAYFLSALWLPLPQWVYILIVAAVFAQLAGWSLMIALLKRSMPQIRNDVALFPRRMFLLVAIAVTIKLLLQGGSVIPSLSQLAFGFRPIVIGYLHLVLLGIITLFILSYSIAYRLISVNGTTKLGIIIFTLGIIINEVFLMTQGIADLNYTPVPRMPEMLLLAACILFGSVLIVNAGQLFSKHDRAHKSAGIK